MYRKMIYLASIVLVLGFVNNANAADIVWSGGGTDNLWSNPANWEGNKVPTAADDALIEVPGALPPNGPLIQDGIDAECSVLWNEVAGEPEMTMTGGTFTISGWGIWWGDGPGCNPTFYQSGGEITLTGSPGIHELGWGGAAGTWIMTGGTMTAKGISIPSGPGNFGTILLHGGTYNVGTERGGLVMREGGLIDITEGTMILEGDETAKINDLIAAGQITSYDGAGVFEIDYNQRNPGMTTVTAMEAGKAYNPSPANGGIYSDIWATLSWSPAESAATHDVYVGDNFDQVNEGTDDTFQVNQGDTFYIVGFPGYPFPDGLVPGTTYYWRIDEVEADGVTKHKGDVWSFTVPPRTAYDPNPADGAESVDPDVELNWTAGFGALLHTVYFGDDYDVVNNATDGTQQGPTTYNPGTLESAKVYYWRVDEYDTVDTYKGDVWSFTTPGAVGSPVPANGATDVKMTAILGWSPADNAASHEVYFGEDEGAVRNADKNSPEYKGSKALGAESYDPGKLSWYATYYWRIDEVDTLGDTQKGPLWSFTTADFISIDDFEDYDAGENQIWYAWQDGLGYGTEDTPPYSPGNGTGSAVGDENTPSYCEEVIVHGGGKSMPVTYDNNKQGYAYYSEVEKTLTYPRDWTAEGVGELTIWFRGLATNDAEPLYVVVSNSTGDPGIVVHDNPAAAQAEDWTKWVIPLQTIADQGIVLTDVDEIALGLGTRGNLMTPGGAGKMYFDDIALNRPAAVPADPSLVGFWTFDEDSDTTAVDSSGNGHDGTAMNSASISGGALVLNGTDQYVEVAHDPALNLTDSFTITAFVQLDATNDRRPVITKEQNPDGSRGWNCWIQDGEPRMQLMDGVKWADTGDVGQSKLTVSSGAALDPGVLHHLAFVYDSAGPEQIYIDGVVQISEDVVTGTLHVNEQPVRIGAYIWDPAGYQKYLDGSIDDVRIYNRVLTADEIEALANAQ